MTTEDTENTEGENDLQCELAAWELLREARRDLAEARGEIKRLRYEAQREAEHHDRMVREMEGLYDQLAKTKQGNEHLCDSHRDMLGNCIVCQMEARHAGARHAGKLYSMSNGGGAKS